MAITSGNGHCEHRERHQRADGNPDQSTTADVGGRCLRMGPAHDDGTRAPRVTRWSRRAEDLVVARANPMRWWAIASADVADKHADAIKPRLCRS
jgi:hypothetical protein